MVFVESKWRSKEGAAQGKLRDKTQMQLRREFFEKHGDAVFGDRRGIVLGITWKVAVEAHTPPDSAAVATRELTWGDLAECNAHPQADEFARHYAWRAQHSKP